MKNLSKQKGFKSNFDLLPKIPMRMRIASLFLAGFLFQANAEALYSQSALVSLKMENATVEEVLNKIEEKSDFYFLYNSKLVNVDRKVSVSVNGNSIETILHYLFDGTDVDYKVSNRQIILSRKEDTTNTITGQHGKIITGTVIDATGYPVIGANVVIKGTTNGTVTDADGKFSLQVSEGDILEVSFIGYLSFETKVSSANQYSVTLKEDSQKLDEIVVVSYGTQKKRELTGAVSTMKADDFADVPVAQLSQKVQGQIPGVQVVQQSGIPGQGMAFRIRGAASINNSSQPLIVVDGMPISTGLNNLNPDDIESFTVLKDAAASSLYGSRAANGVVLITTKKAKQGRTEVTLNTYFGVQTLKGLSDFDNFDMMDAREFAQYKKEWYEDKAKYEGYTDGVPEMYQHPEQYGKGTNWYEEVTRSAATIQNYTLNVSGSKDKFNTNISLGYFKQEGLVVNSNFERFTFRANNDYQVNDKIRLGLNISPMVQNYTNANTDGQRQILSASLSADPCVSPYDENGDLTIAINSPGMFGQPNWKRYANERLNNYRIYTILANAFADVDIYAGIKYKFQISADLGSRRFREWTPSTSQGSWVQAPPNKAYSQHNSEQYYTWTAENLLTYAKEIADHKFDLMAGYSAQKFVSEYGNLNGTDFGDDDIPWISAAATKGGSAGIDEWALASIIGRVNYSFKDRYFLQANIRRDGCSRFGVNNRWATFPSVSAGWVFSDESFMSHVNNVMNYAKVKASYGVTGNYNIGNYDHWSTVGVGNYILGNTLVPGKGLTAIGNSGLTWEETDQWDIGLELGFLNDRIFMTYDFYNKFTDGMLYQIDMPWSTGFDNIKANIGKFRAWGHELSIESRNLIGNFKWKTNLNLTIPRNEVKALGPNNVPIGGYDVAEDWNRLEVGQPIGIIMGYVFDGVYMTQEEFNSQPKHVTSVVGSARMKDTNNDGVIDIYDRVKIADPNPSVLFGITNEFSWKDFDLSIFLQGQIGGDVVAGIYENCWNLDGVFNVSKDVKDRWRSEENPGNGKIPRTYGPSTELFRSYHTGMVYDASYISLRNVTLGYNIPIKKNAYISKIRPYISGQNLAIIKAYPGTNPEASSSSNLSWRGLGIDRTNYPIPRTFTIGCNITF
ncbi:TonB-dependent receptor [Parabacteroides faecis]|uniref:TonB-dependent receptor n=1 Tax=Parabacteroides faecis TaxID=1217282 RepID=UPI002164BB89|nr:TonB-dependent receptor [Parabacteroides faecis]MCS2894095.1 TonB-dependent receptor [Parabacteroides faecis]UVQ47315.1 TonB-dependent receptor [Parabacteroides faecis]